MSKGLEVLQEIKNKPFSWEKLKDSLDIIEKELKALEIIKNKTVDIWLIQNKKSNKEYNSMVDSSRWLSQEEFDLLKEALK